MSVDHTPQAARGARGKVRAALFGILACAIFGGAAAAELVLYLTTPKES